MVLKEIKLSKEISRSIPYEKDFHMPVIIDQMEKHIENIDLGNKISNILNNWGTQEMFTKFNHL
jgi:hypothetical protein